VPDFGSSANRGRSRLTSGERIRPSLFSLACIDGVPVTDQLRANSGQLLWRQACCTSFLLAMWLNANGECNRRGESRIPQGKTLARSG
jgi:hypothetical protein